MQAYMVIKALKMKDTEYVEVYYERFIKLSNYLARHPNDEWLNTFFKARSLDYLWAATT